jgi:hypothetical protein
MNPDNQHALENQQLRTSRDRWRAVAIAALALVFVALIPFSVILWQVVERRESEVVRYLLRKNEELKSELFEKAKTEGK